MSDNLHKGHRVRVKKQFMNFGLDAFNDHQVLELLLFYCVPMKDTNELAHEMLNEFGSLVNLFEADPTLIMSRCRVSMNVAVLISMIPQLFRRYSTNKFLVDRPVLNSTKKIGNYAVALMMGKVIENFYLICLNNQRKLIEAVLVSEGTIDEIPIYPRKIVEIVLKYNATSIVLVHNHPGGSFEPSLPDIEATQKIIRALEPLDIEVLDHIVVAGNAYYSFVERGTIQEFRRR